MSAESINQKKLEILSLYEQYPTLYNEPIKNTGIKLYYKTISDMKCIFIREYTRETNSITKGDAEEYEAAFAQLVSSKVLRYLGGNVYSLKKL